MALAVDDPLGSPAKPGALKPAMKPELAELEARLGHVFADKDLARRALTHSTAPIRSPLDTYERLEFLGDHVLGLVISEMVYETFPSAAEGELSVRYSRLVRRETCAEIAEAWEVGRHIEMGAGEARSGGRKRPTILGDVGEALIGAVFLDAGYEAARALVRRHWSERMAADSLPVRDAKTTLQEWAAARDLATPVYTEVERSGPAHLPRFVMEVALPGYAPERGEASSKRAAEQAAARAFLDRWMNP